MPRSHLTDAQREGRMRTFGKADDAALRARFDQIEASMADREERMLAIQLAALDAVSRGWDLPAGIHFGLDEPALGLPTLEALLTLDAPSPHTLRHAIPHQPINVLPPFDRATDPAHVELRLAQMRLLLANGANPNHRDLDGRSALHHAAMANAPPQAFLLLIEAGADLDVKSAMGSTPRDFIRNMFSDSALPAVETYELRLAAGLVDDDEPAPAAAPAPKRSRL